MSAALTAIPARQRRSAAVVLAIFAALFLAIGALTVSDARSAWLVVIAVVAFVVGALLGLVAWGFAASLRHDTADRRLDDAVQAALAAHGASVGCGCGHDHDPDELHVVDAPDECAHDGSGVACTHDCATCVLAAQRR